VRKIFVPNDKTTLRVFPSLAKEIGLNESLLLLQIEHWVKIGSAPEVDGKKWTYQSTNDIKEKAFPFWSRSTVNRVVNSLVDKGLIFKANYNKAKYDRTIWMSIDYDGLDKLENIAVSKRDRVSHNDTGEVQNETRQGQNGTTIPEITTEITTETTQKAKAEFLIKYFNKKCSKRIKINNARKNNIRITLKDYSLKELLYSIINMNSDDWSIREKEIRIDRLIEGTKRHKNIEKWGHFPESWISNHVLTIEPVQMSAIEKRNRAERLKQVQAV